MENNVNKKLIMTFKTTDDKTVSLSIDDPRDDINETEIKDAMDLVVSKTYLPQGVLIFLMPLVQK